MEGRIRQSEAIRPFDGTIRPFDEAIRPTEAANWGFTELLVLKGKVTDDK